MHLAIKKADQLPTKTIVAAFNGAFRDYVLPLQMHEAYFGDYEQAWNMDLTLSSVALKGRKPLGIALIGRRSDRAWIAGLGMLPNWRGKGIGEQLLAHTHAVLREAGVKRVTLEVHEGNERALQLYRKHGYRELRELLTWQRTPADGPLPDPPARPIEVPAQEVAPYLDAWKHVAPTWLRDPATIRSYLKWPNVVPMLLHDREGKPSGYLLLLFEHPAKKITILDMGANPQVRIIDPGRHMLQALYLLYQEYTTLLFHEPVESSLNRVFVALRYHVSHRYLEMESVL